MYLSTSFINKSYSRLRKGKCETVNTKVKTYNLSCDVCKGNFQRTSKQMKPERACNSFSHVCSKCNPKSFGQRMSCVSRKMKKYDASSSVPINTIFNS